MLSKSTFFEINCNLRSRALIIISFHQRQSIDFHDTFNLVVKTTTVRVVLNLVVAQGWSLCQIDINNVFLHGTLYENAYMSQPPGFIDSNDPNYVCKLKKSIYGLNQAPQAWNTKLRSYILHMGFTSTQPDTSLFIFQGVLFVLTSWFMLMTLFSQVVILIGVDQLVAQLVVCFSLKDLGLLQYFLDVEVSTHPISTTIYY